VNLVGCSTPGGDYRTPGDCYPDDQEHGKYCTRSHYDSLQKIEERNAQAHSNIVAIPATSSEITIALILIGVCHIERKTHSVRLPSEASSFSLPV
jgi:hypothetical protein